MSLSKFERGNTIKSAVEFKMSGNLTDPSGNNAWVHILRPDGSYLVSGGSCTRDSTGKYHYFFRPDDKDLLGIYIVEWYGYHFIGGSYGNKKLIQRDAIQVVDVVQ